MKAIIRSICLLAALLAMGQTGRAEQLYRFDDEVIRRSVQCEFGRAADQVYQTAPQPMLVGKIELKKDETTVVAAQGGVTLVYWHFGGTPSFETSSGETKAFWRNVHAANKVTCNDVNNVNLGVGDCLVQNAYYLKTPGAPIECRLSAIGTLVIDSSVGGNVWIVNASVGASYSKKIAYSITVTVPSERPKSEPSEMAKGTPGNTVQTYWPGEQYHPGARSRYASNRSGVAGTFATYQPGEEHYGHSRLFRKDNAAPLPSQRVAALRYW